MKHNQIERSCSYILIASLFDFDDLKKMKQDLKVKRKVHETLVDDNDWSCYSIEFEFENFHDSEQYQNLFLYWQKEFDVTYKTKRWIFNFQLKRWKEFRQFQQTNRRYIVFHRKYLELQQIILERWQRHKLDDDV